VLLTLSAAVAALAPTKSTSTSHGLDAFVQLKQHDASLNAEIQGTRNQLPNLSSHIDTEPVLGVRGGLGFWPNTGLVNQLLALLGVVMYAHEHGFRYISEDTLKFYGGWDSDGNNVTFASLFNVTHWNSRAMRNQSLPLPLIVRSVNVTEWIAPSARGREAFEKADDVRASKDPSICWFWGSLRPAAPLLKVVERVRPAGVYGVLHARIENDLNTPGIPAVFRTDRLSLPTIYGMITNFSHPCLNRPDRFYMCVMASDVTEPEDASMLERRLTPWENLSLELGGSEAVRQAGLEGSKIQGAVLDFEIARGAAFFIGQESLSTFAMAIVTSRSCAGLQCNVHVGPDGMGEVNLDLDRDLVM